MRVSLRWIGLICGLALAGAIAVVAYSTTQWTPSVSEACAPADRIGPWERQNCVGDYYREQLENGANLDDILRETQYRYLAADPWIAEGCHTPLHAIGDWVKQNDNQGPTAGLTGRFLYCDVGYAHGLTSEYDLTNPDYTVDDLEEYLQACRTMTTPGTATEYSCNHGAGHIVAGLTYQADATPRQWLNAGIEACEATDTTNVDACLAGHFMVWNLFGSYELSENPDGWTDRWFSTWPDLCASVPAQYHAGCLRGTADAHGMYFGPVRPEQTNRPYCPDTAVCPVLAPEQLAERCETYDNTLRTACWTGLGYDRVLQLQPDTTRIERVCGSARHTEDQTVCFVGALQSFEDPLTPDRCLTLSPTYQWVCPDVTAYQDTLVTELMEQRALSGSPQPANTPDTFLDDCQRLLPSDLCQRAVDRVEQARGFRTA